MPVEVPEEVGIPLLILLDLPGVLTKHSTVQLLCLTLHRQPHKVEQRRTLSPDRHWV